MKHKTELMCGMDSPEGWWAVEQAFHLVAAAKAAPVYSKPPAASVGFAGGLQGGRQAAGLCADRWVVCPSTS